MDYVSVLGTDHFTFLIGSEKKEFKVHTNVVAATSAPLSRLMKGNWKEAENQTAELPDVEEQIFGDFLEFAYTGKYSVKLLNSLHKVHQTTALEYRLLDESFDNDFKILNKVWLLCTKFFCTLCGNELSRWSTDTSLMGCSQNCRLVVDLIDKDLIKPSSSHKSSLFTRFCVLCGSDHYHDPTNCCTNLTSTPSCNEHIDTFMRFNCRKCINIAVHAGDHDDDNFRENDALPKIDDLLEGILHHCKIYVFADKYCIKSLQFWSFTFVWMHLSLLRFHMREIYRQEESPDFTTILQYVFDNTERNETKETAEISTDKLRRLIIDFNVDHNHLLRRYIEFADSFAQDPTMTKEILTAALQNSKITRHYYLPEV